MREVEVCPDINILRYMFLPVLACICGASAMSGEKPEPEPPPGPRVCEIGDLVWSDEFNEDGLPNTSKWRYDVGAHGWGNSELQYYTSARSENARVENGSLIIEARRPWTGYLPRFPYSSFPGITRTTRPVLSTTWTDPLRTSFP